MCSPDWFGPIRKGSGSAAWVIAALPRIRRSWCAGCVLSAVERGDRFRRLRR